MTAAVETTEAEVREGSYGARVTAVEPGGAGFIPVEERHGRPLNLFWTWMSPNLEFATIFVGVISVLYFQQTFGQAVAAIVLGTALGSATHGILSARGPSMGVPQMVLSRIGFGYRGNILPAGLNAVVAGIGWFAVNSVSGALALATLTDLPNVLCLIIVVVLQVAVAFFGHNLVQAFERYAFPVLAVIFLITSIITLSKASPSAVAGGTGGIGGFLLTVGASFGYAAGWNPYATDYTRYLAPTTSKVSTGVFAGLGVFVSCTFLEIVGAASATIAAPGIENPTEAFTSHLPSVVANLTLLAIALGAISANAINIYSGSMSFLALGFTVPLGLRRAIVSGVFGVAGFLLAWSGLSDAGHKYENFLLVIAYWIGPWLAVYLTDWFLRRGKRVDGFLYDKAHNPWGGAVAMAIGMVVSIWLFSNQSEYVGPVPSHWPSFGDFTFEVGFVVSAVLYAVFFPLQKGTSQKGVSESSLVA
ncbi:purine-cytosine permease family protein [Paractinoplanes toevensis]|uniref:Purine-cytosine permease YxlA n=1 Tax=Paractinoplanes toevensis TaxID=571911 RepID=A0A919TA41_9ACTN|nr:cytosine permease [Actinoplanes toevensis]GIM90946.1 putative purine-cytosine permease YxlA [Actinoplanes toevensis]